MRGPRWKTGFGNWSSFAERLRWNLRHKFLFPPYDAKLFLNVNPSTMHDEKFKTGFTRHFLRNYKITPDNVIFEITERNRVNDVEGFQKSIDHYKNQNYQIAIDDAGAGYSGLNLISDVHPDYIKLDMKLIRNINSDKSENMRWSGAWRNFPEHRIFH